MGPFGIVPALGVGMNGSGEDGSAPPPPPVAAGVDPGPPPVSTGCAPAPLSASESRSFTSSRGWPSSKANRALTKKQNSRPRGAAVQETHRAARPAGSYWKMSDNRLICRDLSEVAVIDDLPRFVQFIEQRRASWNIQLQYLRLGELLQLHDQSP